MAENPPESRTARRPESSGPAADFSPRLLSLVTSPVPPRPRFVLQTLLCLLALTLAWAFVGRLDVVARAQGKLIPQARLQVVQPLEGGRVAKILVHEGERVRKGQLLLTMDDRLAEADLRKLTQELATSRLQARRVEAELAGAPLQQRPEDDAAAFAKVRAQHAANRAALDSRQRELQAVLQRTEQELSAARQTREKLAQTLPFLREAEQAFAALTGNGHVDRVSLMERKQARIEAEHELQAQRHRVEALQSRIAETRVRIEVLQGEYRKALVDAAVDLQDRIAVLGEEVEKQAYRNALTLLKAPEDGFVKDLATHTIGSVVPAGTVLLSIVPADQPLNAEVLIENKDVGFVAGGQPARIKLASYEFQRYGMIDAQVEWVGADATESGEEAGAGLLSHRYSGYRALLRLERQHLDYDGRQFDLRPGMQLSAEIKLGTRSVLEYLISPIRKGLGEAAREL
jgi:hemolysin D